MGSSPGIRCSPTWERGAENSHKRGRSLESGLSIRSRDDDLMLFNEMQNQERDNFLLHTLDNFDESLSKLRHFSNFKLGISIPTRGDAGDLLNVEGDKSDYDWLLTPPDTPLFSSLDDEYPQPVTLAPRGRARSQPIIISRSMTEKSQQTSRTGSSPHRLSPSPRSSGVSTQMRGRPSLATRSSSPTITRPATPTRRPSTPPKKQLTHTLSSSTPILRRASTGSSVHSSNYGGRAPSPVKTSHGNSASPKLQGWQKALPGFTLEAPPNLRTSLSDRPMSHTRGSSPASRNGSESSGRLGRKSMSPTSSRSIGSSHSHDRDHFSSYSKYSMVSSSDDYEESLRSVAVGISRSPLARKDGSLGSNKAMSFSRKPSRNSPVNCVPKRSFDSALRVMDQHKTPQNMFRPLMSSVPATTFRPIFSRNSSLTTSSNASSEQGVISVALDVEGRELEPTELPVGWERTEDSETLEEVFLFDKADEIIKDASHDVLYRKTRRLDDFVETSSKKFDSGDIQNPMVHIGIETNTTLETTYSTDKDCEINGHKMMAFCSKCSRKFMILDLTETTNLCWECIEEDRICTTKINLTCVPLTKIVGSQMDSTMCTLGKGLLNSEMPDFHEGNDKIMLHQHDMNNILESNSLNICSTELLDQMEIEIFDQNLDRREKVNGTQLSSNAVNSSLKVDITEGTGIPVLLMQRSSSIKRPILQGRTSSASNSLCSEPSYSKDNNISSSSRRSSGRDSLSTSSSVDLVGSYMQTENPIQHQLCREDEVENMRNAIDSEGTSSSCTKCLRYDREILVSTEEYAHILDGSNVNISSPSRPVFSDIYITSEDSDTSTHGSESEQILDQQGNHDLPRSSAQEIMCDEDSISFFHDDEHNNEINAQIVDGRNNIGGCLEREDDYTMLNCTSQNDNTDETTNSSTLNIELQQGFSELDDCQTEFVASHCLDYLEQSNGDTVSQSACDISVSTSEPITAVEDHGDHEESCVTMECSGGRMSRSMTLEEETDTILFCSSIIHDLAYKAATIGMEKEHNLPPPTQTFLNRPIPNLKESAKMTFDRPPRSQKFRRKRIESPTKSPAKEELESYERVQEFTAPNVEIPSKVDSIKPPKLESKCNCVVM